jgi:hypothetical protein
LKCEATAGMLAAQLAQPPATNQTIVGFPRKEAIVAVVPAGVVKVPLGAGVPTVNVDVDADLKADATWCSETTDWTLALAVLLTVLVST